jgi:hypothetical protein
MTAIVILNIVFAVIVVGGMLALMGSAIVRDARAHGTPFALSFGTARRRSRARRARRQWSRELDLAR